MTPLLAAALSGVVCGTAAGLVLDALRHRFLVGPPRSRWCGKCWARAVVRMDGWDTCLRCGDAAWHRDLETYTATAERPLNSDLLKYSDRKSRIKLSRFQLLRGGRPETKP